MLAPGDHTFGPLPPGWSAAGPHPVHLALQARSVSADRVTFIDDSVPDTHAREAAGVTTIAVTWGAGADRTLAAASPAQLLWVAAQLGRVLGV